ncbi:MAG TPA: hypothetical protein VGE07_21035 [Herpetosiphonaceae bacterium]
MTINSKRSWWSRPGCMIAVVAVLALILLVPFVWLNFYQGRTLSRYTGIPVKIDLPDCVTSVDQVVSVSFHSKTSGETIKDVTYKCGGRLYSHEYNDSGFLEGEIEWTIDK